MRWTTFPQLVQMSRLVITRTPTPQEDRKRFITHILRLFEKSNRHVWKWLERRRNVTGFGSDWVGLQTGGATDVASQAWARAYIVGTYLHEKREYLYCLPRCGAAEGRGIRLESHQLVFKNKLSKVYFTAHECLILAFQTSLLTCRQNVTLF